MREVDDGVQLVVVVPDGYAQNAAHPSPKRS